MEINKGLSTSLFGGLLIGLSLALLSYRSDVELERPKAMDKVKELDRKLYADGKKLYNNLEQAKRDADEAVHR